jgi:DNA-binding MarR family transcriptional regulator
MTTKKSSKVSAQTLKQHMPEELLTFQVSVLSQILSRVVEGSVSTDLNLTSRQWRVLVILNRIGPTTSGQVASATHLDHSQVSRASYELVDKGLISMSNDEGDRRKQLLSVTAKGVEVLRLGIVGSQNRQARLRAVMSDSEFKVFSKLLTSLTHEANSMLLEVKGQPLQSPKRP